MIVRTWGAAVLRPYKIVGETVVLLASVASRSRLRVQCELRTGLRQVEEEDFGGVEAGEFDGFFGGDSGAVAGGEFRAV